MLLIASTILLVVGVLLIDSASPSSQQQSNLQQVTQRLQDEIDKVRHQLIPALKVQDDVEDIFSKLQSLESDYPFYLFKNGQLIYWSDNQYVPTYNEVAGEYKYKLLENSNGQYLLLKWILPGSSIEVVSPILLYFNSKIDNRYLSSSYNDHIFYNEDVQISTIATNEMKAVCIGTDQCLFYVRFGNDYQYKNSYRQSLGAVLIAAGLLLAFILVYRLSNYLVKQRGIVSGLTFLIFSLGIMRGITLWLGFPLKFTEIRLFSPEYFASSYINPSIGDLLFNVLLILQLAIFIFVNQQPVIDGLKKAGVGWKWGIGIAGTSLFCLAALQLFLTIQTIYHNSQYALDIGGSLYFPLERVALLVVFVINSTVFFLTSHVLFRMIETIAEALSKVKMIIIFVSGVALFVFINMLTSHDVRMILLLTLVYVVILWLTRFPNQFVRISYAAFVYVFIAMLTSSLLGAIAIYKFEQERSEDKKQRFALQFLIEKDVIAEYLLMEATNNIRDDAFIKSRLFSPFLSKSIIKEKVKRVFLNKYFEKYNVKVHVFNGNGEPYGDAESVNYEQLQKQFQHGEKLGQSNIYFINNRDNNFTKRYINFIEIKNYGLVSGYVVLDLQHKKIIPDNVYPELLVDNRLLLPFINKSYSYAVFVDNSIQFSSGEVNYNVDFNTEWLKQSKMVSNNGYDHLIVSNDPDRYVVISSKSYGVFRIVSNFSFLLLLLMFSMLLMVLIYVAYSYSSRKSLNYSTRIQLYFNLAFFMPLIAVSVTTLSLVTGSYKEEVDHEHYKKAVVISQNIESEILLDEKILTDELENKLAIIATMSDADANLFDTDGKLIASSQPLIYKKNILSERISPLAMRNIVERKDENFTANESVGKLTYNTTYKSIKSPNTGEVKAILSVPYFESELNLEHEKIEVFTTILNIFTIIFIVFLVISYLVSKLLTFPLTLITQKLKQTTLATNNEPLEWKQDDEIGLMVGEYNKMVTNLAESKKALARTEKETAWREIAQQVAHEIKNPLTPMKLTLQHLQRTLGGKQQESIKKPIDSLLHQVDTLSDIANSFSSFAQMPIPEHERYELAQLVRNTVDLHRNTITGKLKVDIDDNSIYTIGDEQLTGRILSNIIINARQSAKDKPLVIFVGLKSINNGKVLLEVTDNGAGIPDEIRDKVFMPNFTTKETGSGIGLAIAKHGIEHAGGKIWFETTSGRGTTFYVELPRVE